MNSSLFIKAKMTTQSLFAEIVGTYVGTLAQLDMPKDKFDAKVDPDCGRDVCLRTSLMPSQTWRIRRID